MKSYKQIERDVKIFNEHSVKCKCGHTMLITSSDGKEICKWCHNYVFATREIEIKYRNKEKFIKLKKELEK
jgi:hypothetical protein